MTSSRIVKDEPYARRIAQPHDRRRQADRGKAPNRSGAAADLAIYGAAASLTATTADYGRFLREILDPKPADAFRLSERGLREYLRPQMKRDEIKSGCWAGRRPNQRPHYPQPCRFSSRMVLRCVTIGRPESRHRHHVEWRQLSALLREAEVGSGVLTHFGAV